MCIRDSPRRPFIPSPNLNPSAGGARPLSAAPLSKELTLSRMAPARPSPPDDLTLDAADAADLASLALFRLPEALAARPSPHALSHALRAALPRLRRPSASADGSIGAYFELDLASDGVRNCGGLDPAASMGSNGPCTPSAQRPSLDAPSSSSDRSGVDLQVLQGWALGVEVKG